MPGTDLVLDAGALIAFQRGDARMLALVRLARAGEVVLRTSSAVVAQVWRDGARQVPLVRLLAADVVRESALDPAAARDVGTLCAGTGTSDVVDAHVAVLALRHDAAVLTSDPVDLRRLGLAEARVVGC